MPKKPSGENPQRKPDRACELQSVTQCGNRVPKGGKRMCDQCAEKMNEAKRAVHAATVTTGRQTNGPKGAIMRNSRRNLNRSGD